MWDVPMIFLSIVPIWHTGFLLLFTWPAQLEALAHYLGMAWCQNCQMSLKYVLFGSNSLCPYPYSGSPSFTSATGYGGFVQPKSSFHTLAGMPWTSHLWSLFLALGAAMFRVTVFLLVGKCCNRKLKKNQNQHKPVSWDITFVLRDTKLKAGVHQSNINNLIFWSLIVLVSIPTCVFMFLTLCRSKIIHVSF